MSSALKRRLAKIEGEPDTKLVRNALDAMGYEALSEHLSKTKFRRDGSSITMGQFLTLDLTDNVLELEQFRGKVPDDVIRAAYSYCRNWTVPPEQRNIVRFRAGVIDEDGCVAPGYRLIAENGCIVAA